MLLIVTMGLLPGIAVAQGLGGTARREAGRRSQTQEAGGPSHTYTNADLGTEPEAAAERDGATPDEEPGATEATPEAPGPATGGARTASLPDTEREEADRLREELDRAAARREERERTWRQRFAAARANLTAAQEEHDAVCHTGAFYVGGG